MVPKFKRHRKKEKFLRADILSSPVNTYKIHKVLGQGVYGKVVECKNVDSKEKMAVKIVERKLSAAAVKEVSILKNLKQLDENKNNLVRFVEHFQQKGCSFLVFEILDMSLYDFLKTRSFRPLGVSEMRVIAQQMLVALNALKSIGLIHGDIKPDNIMLVNHTAQPFKIKLIDFGLAHSAAKITAGTKIQAIGYRAPEVMLGCPMNEAIDMWSLGCVLAFMYLGRHLYPLRCEYESMRILVKMHGQPDDNMLNCGLYSKDFFSKEHKSFKAQWRLKAHTEHVHSTGCTVKPCSKIFETLGGLDDIASTSKGERSDEEAEDTRAFISLLKRILQLYPTKRIDPHEALGHRFITSKHLPCDASSSYTDSSSQTTKHYDIEPSPREIRRFVTSSEVGSVEEECGNLDSAFSPDRGMDEDMDSESTCTLRTSMTIPGSRALASPVPVTYEGKKVLVSVKCRCTYVRMLKRLLSQITSCLTTRCRRLLEQLAD